MAGKPSLPARLAAPALKLLTRVGTRVLIVRLSDPDPSIEFPQLPPGYTTEPREPLDLLPWAKSEYSLSETFLQQADDRGDRCAANFYQDELVGYGFVTRRYAPLTAQIAVQIGEGLQYRYKGWTHPAHRRKHLSHARGRINSNLFPEQSGHRMVTYVEAHNFASRLNHADVQPTFVGLCFIVRLFGRDIPINSPAVTRAGFRLARLDQSGVAHV